MNRIEIIDTGHVSRDDAAFPTLAQLGDGEMLCAYTEKGDGPNAMAGTVWSRSTDWGSSWIREGTILPRAEKPVMVNSLRLSVASDGTILAYGDRNYLEGKGDSRSFGNEKSEPVVCQSSDRGRTWSEPRVIESTLSKAYEITNPIVDAGRDIWLAPAATLADALKLGERVVAFRSTDHGKTWPEHITVLSDPEGKKGFFEQKVINLGNGRLLAAAWTVTLGDYQDLENHFAISNDYGQTWTVPAPTGIRGQTLGLTYLGEDRLLLLSNRRYGSQGVVVYFARFTEKSWTVEGESLLWDAKASRDISTEESTGIDAFSDFAFGLPSAVPINDNNFLSVHWCKEDGIFGIKCTKFREV
jgi:sialidase-1